MWWKDGSILLFDNSGCSKNCYRICRYWIDQKNKTLTDYAEYRTNEPCSAFMGSAQLIDEETDTYLIAYGGRIEDIAFEEYDFSTGTQNFMLRFAEGFDVYAVSCGTTQARWKQ